MNKSDYKDSIKLVGEAPIKYLEKKYCSIIFTMHYFIKIYDKENEAYNQKAVVHEYLWDKEYSQLDAHLVEEYDNKGKIVQIIILNRLPSECNLLNRYLKGNISSKEIIAIWKQIYQRIQKYNKSDIQCRDLYNNYCTNLQYQNTSDVFDGNVMVKDICLKIISDRKGQEAFLDTFQNLKPQEIHGNLFSGNIFTMEKPVIIDPLYYHHIGRNSFYLMDLAAYLVDASIFLATTEARSVIKECTSNLEESKQRVLFMYYVLKLLVRIRFAYYEHNINNSQENPIIIQTGSKLIKKIQDNSDIFNSTLYQIL